jgi:hypothetical protein
MPKQTWANDEQQVLLNGRLSTYLDAQSVKGYGEFWPRLFQDWFDRWPERRELFPNKDESEALTDEEEAALGAAQKVRRDVKPDLLQPT